MATWRYDIYLLVLKNISKQMSPRNHVISSINHIIEIYLDTDTILVLWYHQPRLVLWCLFCKCSLNKIHVGTERGNWRVIQKGCIAWSRDKNKKKHPHSKHARFLHAFWVYIVFQNTQNPMGMEIMGKYGMFFYFFGKLCIKPFN